MSRKTEIAIHIAAAEFDEDPKRARDFNVNAHVCAVEFQRRIPGIKPIAGLVKINIDCGQLPEGNKRYWSAMNYGHFHYRPVELKRYCRKSLPKKQRFTLEMIRDGLLDLANYAELNKEDVITAYEQCNALKFPLDPTYFDRLLAALKPKSTR